MGCGGSKTAAKAGAAPAAAPAATETEGDFKITIENPTGDAGLGLVIQAVEKKYLLVEAIKEEGLIPSWNKANENTPDVQVNAGDFIVVINGKFGDSDAMLAECKATSITLAVKRAPSAAPAAGAPAAEAPAPGAPTAEAPAAEAPAPEEAAAENPSPQAPAAEAAADAPAAEAPAAEAPTAEAPAADAPAAEVPAPEAPVAMEDLGSVSVEPEPTEVGAGASESKMCGC